MKRVCITLFSFLVVITMVLGSFGTAKADSVDNPTVTPVSGDKVFTTEVIAVNKLPGTTVLDELIIPVGYKAGEVQFGGNGVLVKGMDYGKATICSSIRAIDVKQGWGGKIGMWNGTKWVLLPTTIKTPDEAVYGSACATITGSGTYAFLKMIVNTKLLPANLPECDFSIIARSSTYDFSEYWISLWFSTDIPDGTLVSYKVLSMDPPGSLFGVLTGSAFIQSNIVVWLDELMINTSTGVNQSEILVTLPTCQKTITFGTAVN